MEFIHPIPPFSRIFVFQKRGGEYFSGGVKYHFKPGKIYLLPVGQAFDVTYYRNSELLYSHVHVFDQTMFSVFSGISGLASIEDSALACRILEAWRSGNTLRFQIAISDAIAIFASKYLDSMKHRCIMTRKFGNLFDLIKASQPALLRTEDLAEEIGMSRAALSKSFARTMGLPIKEYLLKIQLEKAFELLLFSRLSIAQVAEELGFSTPNYFHRFFKKISGMTPAQYRKARKS